MRSWASLQRELLPLGYQAAAFVSFACPDHGRYRAGLAKLNPRIPCPQCGLACRAAILGLGLTRSPLPLVEEQSAEMKAPSSAHELAYINRVSRSAFERAKSKPRLSKFEREVRRLKLRDDQESQLRSPALRRWAAENRFDGHIPEFLLLSWALPVYERDTYQCQQGR